jgi:hypothetical protein
VTEGARKQGRELGIRCASWLAWSVCTLSLALTALSYLVIALDLSLNAPIYFYWLETTTVAIGYSVIGAIIASRLPDQPIGWICCVIGFMGAVEHFAASTPSTPYWRIPWRLRAVKRCCGFVSGSGLRCSGLSCT